MLKVYILRALTDNFVYILRDESSGKTAVIDPSTADVVEKFLEQHGWRLDQIFCTHHHHDHVGGAVALKKKFAIPIYTSAYDFQRISGATIGLCDQETLSVGDTKAIAISIPGHTLGHWALYFPVAEKIFVGDTLFSAGCGRLFEGTYQQMFSSLKKLKKNLKPKTEIYFGHEYTLKNLAFVRAHHDNVPYQKYRNAVESKLARGEFSTPTTLETELEINPFLRAESLQEFKKIREERDKF